MVFLIRRSCLRCPCIVKNGLFFSKDKSHGLPLVPKASAFMIHIPFRFHRVYCSKNFSAIFWFSVAFNILVNNIHSSLNMFSVVFCIHTISSESRGEKRWWSDRVMGYGYYYNGAIFCCSLQHKTDFPYGWYGIMLARRGGTWSIIVHSGICWTNSTVFFFVAKFEEYPKGKQTNKPQPRGVGFLFLWNIKDNDDYRAQRIWR